MTAEAKNEFCKGHSGIDSRLESLEHNRDEAWGAIDKLQNRLPAWATVLISLLTFALGASMTYAALAVKLAQA